MSEKKNIDRLFQEKFKDFEVNPPEVSWANIEAKLDGKKKRRVIPFWWKLSGVAAVFLIGFFVSKSIYDGGAKSENPVVNQENSNTINGKNSNGVNKNGVKNNGGIQSGPRNTEQVKQNTVVNENNIKKSGQENSKGIINNKGMDASDGVAATSDKVRNKDASDTAIAASDKVQDNDVAERKNKVRKAVNSAESTVAERRLPRNRSLKNKSGNEKDKAPVVESVFEKQQNQLAQNQNNKNKSTAENGANANDQPKQIAQTNSNEKDEKETQNPVDRKTISLDDLKGNVNSKIATKEIEKKVNDTVPKASVANNELEELLNEKESKSKKGSKRNRWQLASNVAPIFLGSASNGSPIDSTLSKNSKSYNTNVGFGLGVSYAVNHKLSIRTGINKVNMSYDTNDISFFTGIQAKTLQGVRPVATSAMIHVESSVQTSSPVASEGGLLPFENSFVHKSSGYLRQEMGYLEMPVEMTYNLLDKKFGLKIIGGFSTMFLQDNNITIISDDRDTFLGEANNLNDVHFSTNLGLGLKYNFMKSFEFNIEPTVKYQLNTYSSNAGNFKPYLFGIYSGISYKF
jgi:hypothetical protein